MFEGYLTRDQEEISDQRRNMGIGLSVCLAIVRAHGGCLTAENRPDAKVYRFPDLLDIFPKRGQVAVEKLIPPEDGQ